MIYIVVLFIILFVGFFGYTTYCNIKQEQEIERRKKISHYRNIINEMDELLLNANHIPYSIGSIVVAALMIQMVCALINIKWKISTHSAGIGGVAGALIAFAEIFAFNPVWWLCLVLLLAGLVGTSRMILRQHTLAQVVCGFFVGMVCSFIAVLFI